MFRVQLEVPADGNKEVLAALRAVGAALKVSIEESATAPPDSYGLSVHVYPDKKE